MAVLIGALALALLAGCDRGKPADQDVSASPSVVTSSVQSPSTVDPLIQAGDDLRRAQSVYYEAYLRAASQPRNSKVVSQLLSVYQEGSPGQRDIRKRLKALGDNGFAGRPGPKGYYVVQSVNVSSVEEGATARVTVCSYFDGVMYDTKHKGPDGKPITVDDTVESGRTRYRYINQAGAWKLVGGDVLKSWRGENRCPKK